jgi:hypothetical protein
MELTPGQRRLVFVVIVLALVGLGVYVISARNSGGTPAAAPSASAAAPSASATTPYVPPSSVPTPSPVSTAGGAEIYQWLPFTPAGLTAAAQATVSFAKAYVTWSYTQSAQQYGATMSSLVTPSELQLIEAGYATPGLASTRTSEKQVSTGSGTIASIASFGANPTTIIFMVTIDQKVTSTQPAATTNQQYDITVSSNGGAWQVSDIEAPGAGNH